MQRQRLCFYGILLTCLLGFGVLGVLTGRALRGHAVLAIVALGLVLLGGGLTWVR